jgi:hypothetical protein
MLIYTGTPLSKAIRAVTIVRLWRSYTPKGNCLPVSHVWSFRKGHLRAYVSLFMRGCIPEIIGNRIRGVSTSLSLPPTSCGPSGWR